MGNFVQILVVSIVFSSNCLHPLNSIIGREMKELLTKSDMETPRKPSELAEWYYAKYEKIRSSPDEVKKARLHRGFYAYFVPEIYPLVLYSLWRFPHDDVLCQPKIGNQEYDATIYPLDEPNQTHTVEVTWPQDGKENKTVADLMNTHGFHGRVGDDFEHYNRDILQRVLSTAEKKSLKDYRALGGSALLIVLDTECSPLEKSERLSQISSLSADISKIEFLVDSVYLIATPHEGIHIVIEQPTTG